MSAPVALVVRDPGPDDLAGVGVAVDIREIGDAQAARSGWDDLDGGGASEPSGLVAFDVGRTGAGSGRTEELRDSAEQAGVRHQVTLAPTKRGAAV